MPELAPDVAQKVRLYDRRVQALIRRGRTVRARDVWRIRRAYSDLLREASAIIGAQTAFGQVATRSLLVSLAQRIDDASRDVEGIVAGGIADQAAMAREMLRDYAVLFDEYGRTLTGLSVNTRALDAITDFSADLIGLRTGGLGARILGKVNTAIRLGALGVQDQRRAIASISQALGRPAAWSYQAERIYVTETLRAHSIVTEQGIQDLNAHRPTGKKWSWSHIAREEHAAVNGQVVTADGKFRVPLPATKNRAAGVVLMRYPRDPAAPAEATIFCFVPETPVEGRFVGALKTRYAGPIREIETARGHRLRVTPNHPVLTRDGWLPAEALREGQHLFSRTRDLKPRMVGDVDCEHAPAQIHQVFEAFRSDRTAFTAVLRGHDLHGDAARGDGHVDVVGAYRELALRGRSAVAQCDEDLALEFSNAGLPLVLGTGALDLRLQRIAHSRASGVRRAHLALPGARVGTDGLPLHHRLFGGASKWNASTDQERRYGFARDPEFLGELKHAASGEIAPDEIVAVRKLDFVGHVFDLQSEGGWLLASGIIASNCGCYVVPVPMTASGRPLEVAAA